MFGVSLERQLELHPNLKMLVVKDSYSGSLLKGAVAGMSKRDNVEKLTVKCSGTVGIGLACITLCR